MIKKWELVERICVRLGCGGKFRVLPKSKQLGCNEIHDPNSDPRAMCWTRQIMRGHVDQGRERLLTPVEILREVA